MKKKSQKPLLSQNTLEGNNIDYDYEETYPMLDNAERQNLQNKIDRSNKIVRELEI